MLQSSKVSVVIVAGLIFAGGCAGIFSRGSQAEVRLTATAGLPAAEGKLRVAKQSGGNQLVDVEVQHLARPDKAFPGASTYVVWLVPEGGAPAQNMGALPLDDDLKGHLRTQTPHKTFEVVITAEAAPNVISPSENRALSALVRMPG